MCQTLILWGKWTFTGTSRVIFLVEFHKACLIFFHLLCVTSPLQTTMITKSVNFVTSSEFFLVVGSVSWNLWLVPVCICWKICILNTELLTDLCSIQTEQGGRVSYFNQLLKSDIFSCSSWRTVVYNKVGCCICSINILVVRSSTGESICSVAQCRWAVCALCKDSTASHGRHDWWRSRLCGNMWFAGTAGVYSCSCPNMCRWLVQLSAGCGNMDGLYINYLSYFRMSHMIMWNRKSRVWGTLQWWS